MVFGCSQKEMNQPLADYSIIIIIYCWGEWGCLWNEWDKLNIPYLRLGGKHYHNFKVVATSTSTCAGHANSLFNWAVGFKVSDKNPHSSFWSFKCDLWWMWHGFPLSSYHAGATGSWASLKVIKYMFRRSLKSYSHAPLINRGNVAYAACT